MIYYIILSVVLLSIVIGLGSYFYMSMTPVDCQTSDWSKWSDCDKACGNGKQKSTRTVIKPAANGGMACGTLEKTQTCNIKACPKWWNCIKSDASIDFVETEANEDANVAKSKCNTSITSCNSLCEVRPASHYSCHDNIDTNQGDVKIWWGHTEGDASWACNNWISKCGSSTGGCNAKLISLHNV